MFDVVNRYGITTMFDFVNRYGITATFNCVSRYGGVTGVESSWVSLATIPERNIP